MAVAAAEVEVVEEAAAAAGAVGSSDGGTPCGGRSVSDRKRPRLYALLGTFIFFFLIFTLVDWLDGF